VSDDRIVAGSLFHDAGLVTANARPPKSWSSNMEPGGDRVLPSGVKNEQQVTKKQNMFIHMISA